MYANIECPICIQIPQVVPIMFYYFPRRPGSNLESHIAFGCQVSLISFKSRRGFSAFIFDDLDIWGEYRSSILYHVPQYRLFWCFLITRFRSYFLTGKPQKWRVRSERWFFSIHQMKRHLVSNCPNAGDVNFKCLVKVMSSRTLHCIVTIFIISK